MENLQIEAGYVLKLVGICCGGVAYYFSLRNSFGILNERVRMNKRLMECTDKKIDDHIYENREEHKRIYDKIECKKDKP